MQKYRNSTEWTELVLRYVTDEKLSDTQRQYAEKLLEDAEVVVRSFKGDTDEDCMWRQLNKYWLYLKTLKKEVSE
jgi:hypothetical protein